jgi:leader peptidase (prepilin peptidase)/N-methyltransferase
LIAVFAGLIGAAVGSFGNVVIHRVPRGMSLSRPPSACPACGTPIGPRDNVPVLSYLLLRGRCRACGARISMRYPVVEAAVTALWVLCALRFEDLEVAAFVALASTVLGLVALIDLEHRRIPNAIVLPATVAALVWVFGISAATIQWSVFVRAVACGGGFFAVLLVIALVSGGMGFGDVKLAAFIGVVTGRFGVGVAVAGALGGFIFGGLVAVALLVTRRSGRKDTLAFGPWMAFGAVAALFAGEGPVRSWLGL